MTIHRPKGLAVPETQPPVMHGRNERIHIHHVLVNLEVGGIENGVVNVVNNLQRERFDSSVCCLQSLGTFAARLQIPRTRVHELGILGKPWVKGILRLSRLLRITGADIVHTHNKIAFFYGIAAGILARTPTIVHSEHGRTLPDSRALMLAQRCLLPAVGECFAVSRKLRCDLIAHLRISGSRIGVVYNGVDVERFSQGDRSARHRLFGVKSHQFVIGLVGRLHEVKNHQLLFFAASRLVPRSGLRLVLVGEGGERDQLQALAESLGIRNQVSFLGNRDDIPDLLAAFDVFVLPSLSEGMSHALLEAMAAGLPVVASRVGGNVEAIRDLHNGLLFESGNVEALRDCLERLRRDPRLRRTLGAAARATVLSEFSLKRMVGDYEQCYQRAFQKARRGLRRCL